MVFKFRCFNKYISKVLLEQAFKEINTVGGSPTLDSGHLHLSPCLTASVAQSASPTYPWFRLEFNPSGISVQDFMSGKHSLRLLSHISLLPHFLLTSALLASDPHPGSLLPFGQPEWTKVARKRTIPTLSVCCDVATSPATQGENLFLFRGCWQRVRCCWGLNL